MKPRIELLVSAALFLILILSGCGGTNSSTTSSALPAEARAISVTIGASPDHLGAAETASFTATVSNATNTAVTWSLSGCTSACGTINDSGVYTAPPFVASATTVTITATSRADASKSASVNLALRPVSVSVAPNGPGNVMLGATQSYTATLDHDPKNAGVTWTLSGAGCSGDNCGTLMNMTTTSAMYYAPAAEPSPNTVTLVATSVTDVTQKASVTLTISGIPFLLEGKYAFLINGYRDGTMEAIAGQFTADGKGSLTGVWDANRGAAAEVAQAITGSYNIQPDGHGTMTIQAGSATFTYIVSVDAVGATGRFAEATVSATGERRGSSGYMVRQDPNSFNLSAVEGDRVIAVYGEATGSHVAALGHIRTGTGTSNESIILTGTGSPQDSIIDLSWDITSNTAKFPNTVPLSGKFSAPDVSTGRGTAALAVGTGATATYHFAYYIISQVRLLLVQTDARGLIGGLLIPTLSGEVRSQSYAGLDAPFVFHLTGEGSDWILDSFPTVGVGQMVPSGSGSLNVTSDWNLGGTMQLSAPFTTAYSVLANGRVKLDWVNAVAYLVDQNKGYFMTPEADGARFGEFEPQTSAPFSVAALAGSYLVNTGPPAMSQLENDAGWMTLDENGNGTATLYINGGSGAVLNVLTATVTVASNGRGTLVLNTNPPSAARNLVFWAISPERWVAISTVNPADTKPVLLFIERQGR